MNAATKVTEVSHGGHRSSVAGNRNGPCFPLRRILDVVTLIAIALYFFVWSPVFIVACAIAGAREWIAELREVRKR